MAERASGGETAPEDVEESASWPEAYYAGPVRRPNGDRDWCRFRHRPSDGLPNRTGRWSGDRL
jgi:hypothetical protein